ncbi:MAG: hypothetical protein KF774_15885 [Planctomyces sp.]|nr:hypothetical protein [Planctomyces sp.]
MLRKVSMAGWRKSTVRRWKHALLSGGALALATVSWGNEDLPPLPGGPTLNGILPAEVPLGLTADDFAVLGGKWTDWGDSAAVAVEELFRDHDSLESLESDLARVEIKLGTMRKALDDNRYQSLHGPLADLYGRLRRRVDVAQAILRTQQADAGGARQRTVDAAFGELQDALSGLDRDLRRVTNGARWLPYVRADELHAAASRQDAAPDLLIAVKDRLAGRSTLAEESQRNFLGRDSFIRLERAIDGVLSIPPASGQDEYIATLRDVGAALFVAIEDYEQRRDEVSARAIRDQYQAWRDVAADGGEALSDVMRTHYLNFNFRTVASEGFLRRLFRETRQESSWVNDRVMEAQVRGYQCTTSNIDVDVRPSANTAAFVLKLEGHVQSNTNAFTDQATVHTVGNHTFRAEKDLWFDGHLFTSTGCRVAVGVNNRTVNADTGIRIPIIRGIANGIAMREVEKRRPQTDAITRNKISTQVGPRLDSEVRSQFDKASTNLEAKLYGPLRELESYPQELAVNSTDTAIIARARLMESGELGGGQWPEAAAPTDGILIQVHESLLNNSLERAGFAGREMTREEVEAELRARIEKLLGRPLERQTIAEEPTPEDEEEGADANATFLFDSRDAVRFHVSDGEVRIVLRTGLRRPGNEDIPTHIIEMPLGFTVDGDQIIIKRTRTVTVRAVERSGGRGEQIVRGNIMRANIQRLLPERTIKSRFDLEQGNKKIAVRVTDVTPRDGWVTVTAR